MQPCWDESRDKARKFLKELRTRGNLGAAYEFTTLVRTANLNDGHVFYVKKEGPGREFVVGRVRISTISLANSWKS